MIFVTGGTGLVGSHLLYKLVQENNAVRALYRSEEKLKAVAHVFSYFTDEVETYFSRIEWVKGDILDVIVLEKQLSDVTHVYHCAALISFDPNDFNSLKKINIEGTANIINLCISKSIKKLCYVSSIAAIGDDLDGKEITENTPWNPEENQSVYAITKHGAEMEVWRGTQEGLDVVIVNPGIILGGGFWYSGSGALFKKVYKGLSYNTNAVNGYVDIHDVINQMVFLMKSSVKNERYILVGDNWSFKNFAECTANHLNVNAPRKEVKTWQLKIAWRLDWLQSKLYGKRRRLTKQLAKSLLKDSYYSNKKIVSVNSGYIFKPIKTSIKEVTQLFLQDL